VAWTPNVEAAKQALLAEMDAFAISIPVMGDLRPFARAKMDPVVDKLIGVVSEGVRSQIRTSTVDLNNQVRTATVSAAAPLALAFVGLAVGIGAIISSTTR